MSIDRRAFLKIMSAFCAAPAIPAIAAPTMILREEEPLVTKPTSFTWDFGECDVTGFSISLSVGELITSRIALRSRATGCEVDLETIGRPDKRFEVPIRDGTSVRLSANVPEGPESQGTIIMLNEQKLGEVRSIVARYAVSVFELKG